MDRRDFTRSLMGLPFLFGAWKFQEGGQDAAKQASGPPKVLELARARMKERGLPGLVFVLPRDQEQRDALGRALLRLSVGTPDIDGVRGFTSEGLIAFNRERRQLVALTATCVFVCLETDEARRALGTTAARIVIDEKGRVLRTLEAAPKDPEKALGPRLVALVHGAKLEHLEARVAPLRAAFPEKERTAREEFLAKLVSDIIDSQDSKELHARRQDERAKLAAWIKEDARRIAWPGLVLLRDETERDGYYASSNLEQGLVEQRDAETDIPLGTVLPEFVSGGCGFCVEKSTIEEDDDDLFRIACGMPSLSSIGGRFLRFSADVAKKK
ncbi:MAG: hypothetical protein R3F20_06295 [Planctomycetota bacterium]